ncbi:MAG TPA: SRPBCC domain-containing protein [Terriglobales bacterium]|nr:SRPBCC domain-containing protein [Terriglobales bacterium]
MDTARITKARGLFSMSCGVELNIRAPAERIWSLLTDASGFPRWNSTVTRVEGEIREGEQLRLHVPGTDRTFTPRVSGVVPEERMTWTGGVSPVFKGVRTFELKRRDNGSSDFVMEERFSGLLLPFVRGSMPDFGSVFERYANDLKHEAELAPSSRQGSRARQAEDAGRP